MNKKTNKSQNKNIGEQELLKEIHALSKEIKELSRTKDQKELVSELKSFSKEVKKIKEMEVIQIFKRPIKFLWFSLLKGLMIGLGSVLGATVLVALLIYVLSKISFIPILGSFVEDILVEIGADQETLETTNTEGEKETPAETTMESEKEQANEENDIEKTSGTNEETSGTNTETL